MRSGVGRNRRAKFTKSRSSFICRKSFMSGCRKIRSTSLEVHAIFSNDRVGVALSGEPGEVCGLVSVIAKVPSVRCSYELRIPQLGRRDGSVDSKPSSLILWRARRVQDVGLIGIFADFLFISRLQIRARLSSRLCVSSVPGRGSPEANASSLS